MMSALPTKSWEVIIPLEGNPVGMTLCKPLTIEALKEVVTVLCKPETACDWTVIIKQNVVDLSSQFR